MKKNSNKRSSKKGLVPALLATLCSVGALTSVSYAWFTMGNEASVGNIDVNVQAADGMQISADASSWKSLLPVEDLQGVNTNNFPTELKPVSTDGTVTNGVQQMFLGKVEDDGNISAVLDANKNYVMFDLYIKLDNDKKLSLASGSSVTGENNSHLASRVSFVNEGVDGSGNPETAKALSNGNSSVIWEPNDTTFNATNQNNNVSGKQTYQGVNSAITYENGSYKATEVTPDDLDTPEVNEQEMSQYSDHFSDVTTLSTTYNNELKTENAIELLDLAKGINKVRVYIWLEGQDIDCTNEISAGSISVNLNFSVPEEPQNA